MNRPKNIADIHALKPHHSAEVICIRCKARYMCVWPVGTPMNKLECGHCHRTGFIITTGERNEDFQGGDE